MAKHIGIVAVSPEGSSFCYRLLGRRCSDIASASERPEITLHNRPFSTYVEALSKGDWPVIAQMLRDSAHHLARCGADFCILPDNVCHHALPMAEVGSPLPWINMIEEVAAAAQARGCKHVGLIGTQFVTFGSTYQTALGLRGIHLRVPAQDEARAIDRIIFDEAIYNRVTHESRQAVLRSIESLQARGCEAVILGTTEGSLLVDAGHSPLPIFDPVELLVDAAIRRAGVV